MIDKDFIKNLNTVAWSRGHNNTTEDLGFGYIHYSLVRNLKPDFVLSIGSQRGYIPAILALACMDNGIGHVDFVDAGYSINDEEDQNSWGGLGVWRDVDNKYFDQFKAGLSNFISIHNMTTKEFVKKYRDSGEVKKYKYAYIDGDHSLEGVTFDYKVTYNLVEKGGLITFHDVEVNKGTKWGRCGVREFWKDKPYTKSIGFEKLTIPLDCGLGILRKL